MKRFILILSIASILNLFLSQDLIVSTNYGDIAGFYDEQTGNRNFLGIPYASPPIGPYRFKPPQPMSRWDHTLKADKFGASCNQVKNKYISDSVVANQSENCLFLNVFTPSNTNTTSPLAVMVWIHGGAFKSGSTTEPEYNANNLSKQTNVIVVSLNYRLGIFGFFASENLTKEDPEWNSSGNYGLLDQNMALLWVKENIAFFGGDPENITLFGESAGSFTICFHMLMPKSKGLFKRAILESGSCALPIGSQEKSLNRVVFYQDALSTYERFSKIPEGVGCHDKNMTCMRNISQEEIVNYQNSNTLDFLPYVDGVIVPGDPYQMFKNGLYHKVEVIIGTTLNEGTYFSENITYDEFVNRVKFFFPVHYSKILEFYPLSIYKSSYYALSQLLTDNIFLCPTRNFLKSLSANNSTAYQYLFVAVPSFLTDEDKLSWGSFHSSELQYVFNQPLNNWFNKNNSDFTKDDLVLSDQIMDFWSSFAKTGTPSSSRSLVEWDKFTISDQNYIKLNATELKIEKNLSESICDFYESLIAQPLKEESLHLKFLES